MVSIGGNSNYLSLKYTPVGVSIPCLVNMGLAVLLQWMNEPIHSNGLRYQDVRSLMYSLSQNGLKVIIGGV
jgi:uncharacterized protein YacL (UPF0231 family)